MWGKGEEMGRGLVVDRELAEAKIKKSGLGYTF